MGHWITSFLGFNLDKLLEEVKIYSTPSLEQQAINQSTSDHTCDSHPLVSSKTHSFVKQSSHVLSQMFVKDSDSKRSMVSIPVESEDQPEIDVTQIKLSSRRIPKTKGWAPKLTTRPTVTPKEVCIP